MCLIHMLNIRTLLPYYTYQVVVRETYENLLTKLLPKKLFTDIFLFVSALKQLIRGKIRFFHDSELIASIYISP